MARFTEDFEQTKLPEEKSQIVAFSAEVISQSERLLAELKGPSVIRQIEITPEFLRSAVLKIYWDGSAEPSVVVPLGDFFGSVWHRTRYQSRFFGLEGDTFVCRFPMPFKTSARIAIANESKEPLRLKTEIQISNDWKNDMGYFHAAWHRSGPKPGRPHPILLAEGRGKYVGCILSATSFDRSWWLLESDEYMIRDHETKPCWHGTGLEDYFNAAWYYKNVIARPLHGLVFKAPYRTVQYRLHDLDAVHFDEKMAVMLERGPGNASHGTFESTAFYYIEKPTGVTLAADRIPPKDPLALYTLMGELANLERFNDYVGASEAIDQWLTVYSRPQVDSVLHLRQIAIIERLQGIDVARPLYEEFIEETTSAVAKQYAEQLLWFHESPSHALLTVFCKNRTSVYLDGRKISEGGNPQHLVAVPLKLTPGTHAMSLESEKGQYPDWVQACLRTHDGLIYTDLDWRFSFPTQGVGDWRKPGFDESSWYIVKSSYVEGPPAAPYVWMAPHPFVDMHSKPFGIWISEEWPAGAPHAVFRKEFTSQ